MTEKEERVQNKLFGLIFVLLGFLVFSVFATFILNHFQSSHRTSESITNIHREYIYDENAFRYGINEMLMSDRDLYFNTIGFYTNITRNADIAETIIDAAISGNVPVNIAFAIAWQESRFNPEAINVNNNGTRDNGLFQINEYYHPDVNPLNIEEASFYAMEYLNIKYSMFDSWDIAIMLYNAGTVANISEHNLRYLASVLDRERDYDEQFNNFRRNLGIPNIRD